MKFKKPCLDCGQLSYGNRCPQHQQVIDNLASIRRAQVKKATNQYGSGYARRAKFVRETAITCHICGEGYKPNDPFEADHINAGTDGATAELKPAHGTCNRKRGNKPLK